MNKKITVKLKETSYPIHIGRGSIYQLKPEIEKLKLHKNILVVIDANVEKLFGKELHRIFGEISAKVNYYILPSGEKSKSFQELNKIHSLLIENNYGRDSLIAAVGGGVTGDLAGFAAATFMRGVQYMQIPTTLLAAVDSSVGGKTGLNFKNTKNMIGAFYQPKLVIVDTAFISSLPEAELASGIGEIVKYGFLSDKTLFDYIEKNMSKIKDKDHDVIANIIYKSLLIKSQVVMQDEKESALRKILNLGHTFAHAYESETKFKIKHGQAVTAGVIAAIYLSNKMGLLEEDQLPGLLSLPMAILPPKKIVGLNKNNLINAMMHDKKNTDGKINFVLVRGVGQILINVEAGKKDILYALEKTEKLIKSN